MDSEWPDSAYRELWPCFDSSSFVKAYSYDLNTSKMILALYDADSILEIGEDDEDVLNEVRFLDLLLFVVLKDHFALDSLVSMTPRNSSHSARMRGLLG